MYGAEGDDVVGLAYPNKVLKGVNVKSSRENVESLTTDLQLMDSRKTDASVVPLLHHRIYIT